VRSWANLGLEQPRPSWSQPPGGRGPNRAAACRCREAVPAVPTVPTFSGGLRQKTLGDAPHCLCTPQGQPFFLVQFASPPPPHRGG
jgi:hypothetical protein